MADYNGTANMPPFWEGTKYALRPGVQERIATNGAVRLRALQSTPKYDIVAEHGMMTQTQRNALVSFYNANRTVTFTVTLPEDSVLRTVLFAAMPYTITPLGGSSLYKATVYMREA